MGAAYRARQQHPTQLALAGGAGYKPGNPAGKPGDDFAGRIYVAVEHPLFFWRSRVLAYVHASELDVDTHWPNPFTGQFHMWVVSNGDRDDWQSIERRILDDWEVAFGDRPDHFDAIGLMADSDNSGQQTNLCLADLEIQR